MTDKTLEDRKKLEHILEEIVVREQHEDDRAKTANAKLTSALAVLPIIIALATSAFFTMLPLAARLGAVGKALATSFLVPIGFFGYAVVVAFRGLDPARGTYSVVGMGVIRKFVTTGTYDAMLRKMISERGDAVKADSTVNGWKFGVYTTAAQATTNGLIGIIIVAFLFLLAFVACPNAFVPPAPNALVRNQLGPAAAVDRPSDADSMRVQFSCNQVRCRKTATAPKKPVPALSVLKSRAQCRPQ